MKKVYLIIAFILFLLKYTQAQSANFWQVGLGLGELPIGSSFKPSISFGYQFNDKLYVGTIYQFKDKIQRDGSSFNAKSAELDGLISSSEEVAQRFMLQMRYSPLKQGPYISTGIVYNGKDVETMRFDSRSRIIDGEEYNGGLTIAQTRPAGWGVAMGIGYQYNINKYFVTNIEWAPAWFQYPTPQYQFTGDYNLSDNTKIHLENKMNTAFKSSVTNMYKVFNIGFAYKLN